MNLINKKRKTDRQRKKEWLLKWICINRRLFGVGCRCLFLSSYYREYNHYACNRRWLMPLISFETTETRSRRKKRQNSALNESRRKETARTANGNNKLISGDIKLIKCHWSRSLLIGWIDLIIAYARARTNGFNQTRSWCSGRDKRDQRAEHRQFNWASIYFRTRSRRPKWNEYPSHESIFSRIDINCDPVIIINFSYLNPCSLFFFFYCRWERRCVIWQRLGRRRKHPKSLRREMNFWLLVDCVWASKHRAR